MDRRIAHLDMDAFYASVELQRYPQLRGQPLVVGGRRQEGPVEQGSALIFPRLRSYAGRGVVTTATYEARAFGVHSGMGLMKAAALAPDAILLPADFEAYSRYSRRFKAAVAEIAPHIEDRGIDEIYIDLTQVAGETVNLAQRIKDSVRRATGLSCSMGIAPNKLLAKIASELDKAGRAHGPHPCGSRHANLAASRPPDQWRGSEGEHQARDPRRSYHWRTRPGQVGMLIEHFGERYGRWLADVAQGHDERPVVTEREPKSVSRETTFERDLDPGRDREALSRTLSLCASAWAAICSARAMRARPSA